MHNATLYRENGRALLENQWSFNYMISTAEEFVRLRTSDNPQEYSRAASEHAERAVWLDIVGRFPEMRIWVAHNKTVPIEVLDVLAHDLDPAVRLAVAMKNKLSDDLFLLLACSSVHLRLTSDSASAFEQTKPNSAGENSLPATRWHIPTS